MTDGMPLNGARRRHDSSVTMNIRSDEPFETLRDDQKPNRADGAVGYSSPSATHSYRALPSFGFQHQAEVKFPWGINPVLPRQQPFVRPSSRSPSVTGERIAPACTVVGSSRDRSPTPVRSRHPLVVSPEGSELFDKHDFVDTSDFGTGIEPLFEIIKSIYAFFVGGRPTSPDSLRQESEDLEAGFRDAPQLNPVSCARASLIERRQIPPLRFPSSVEELFANASPPFSHSLFPRPLDPPPAIPDLPLPIPRNYY